LSKARAEELTRIKTDLQAKFAQALKSIDAKIESESREEEDLYKSVGDQAAKLAAQTDSTADGILAIRLLGGRRGGPQ